MPCLASALRCCALAVGSVVFALSAQAKDDAAPAVEEVETKEVRRETAQANDLTTNEDPDARRRAERETAAAEPELGKPVPGEPEPAWGFSPYASVRLHAINNFDIDTEETSSEFGDGASRVGVEGEWTFVEGWELFGRVESGFDVLDSFTPKAQSDASGINWRLHYAGIESDLLFLKWGKSWSAYYKVAGAADRFSIFGGEALGVYNAGTDGGAAGTGRADQALQTQFYIEPPEVLAIKPFNVNIQYQPGQAIPHVRGAHYSHSWSASAWLESEGLAGIGLAWHRAYVENLDDPAIKAAGIDDDAQAVSLALKTSGASWLASLAFARHRNIETNERNRYFDGRGVELFAQFELTDRWWLLAGGNWLLPDDDEDSAGSYEVQYGVLGLRYTFDSFNRMIYAEFRDDHGKRSDGRANKNEFTVGIRWDW